MGIETDSPRVFVIGEELGGVESFLEIIGPECKVLIETQGFLAVEVDIEEFAGTECLGELVVGIEPGHLDMGSLWVDPDQFGMLKGLNEGQHATHGG